MVKTCLNPYSNGMLTQYLQLDGLITVGVLILILMECLLRTWLNRVPKLDEKCLNPYSNGMLTQIEVRGGLFCLIGMGLNPYSNGMLTQPTASSSLKPSL